MSAAWELSPLHLPHPDFFIVGSVLNDGYMIATSDQLTDMELKPEPRETPQVKVGPMVLSGLTEVRFSLSATTRWQGGSPILNVLWGRDFEETFRDLGEIHRRFGR